MNLTTKLVCKYNIHTIYALNLNNLHSLHKQKSIPNINELKTDFYREFLHKTPQLCVAVPMHTLMNAICVRIFCPFKDPLLTI